MGYQETMLKLKYKELKPIQERLQKDDIKFLVDILGYYFNPREELKDDSIIYLVVAGDRHPLADVMVNEFKSKPIEDVFPMFLEVLYDAYEFCELYRFPF